MRALEPIKGIDPSEVVINHQTHDESQKNLHTINICVNDPDVYRELLITSHFNSSTTPVNFRLIAENNILDKITSIVKFAPHIIILNIKGSIEDDGLIHRINSSLPSTCCIALGDTSSFLFRMRCHAAGAAHVLDRKMAAHQMIKILRSKFNY